jgi:hypothetical protein
MSWTLICNTEAISSQLIFSYRQVEKLPHMGFNSNKFIDSLRGIAEFGDPILKIDNPELLFPKQEFLCLFAKPYYRQTLLEKLPGHSPMFEKSRIV